MAVTLNGNAAVPQPSGLKEEPKQKQTDRTTIKGVTHRYWEAQKWQTTLKYTALNSNDYATLSSLYYAQGAAVTYVNTNTGVSFTGFPTVTEDNYIPGASYLKNMEVILVQI